MYTPFTLRSRRLLALALGLLLTALGSACLVADEGLECLEDCVRDDDCATGLACHGGICAPEECLGCGGQRCSYTYDPEFATCNYSGCD